MACPKLDTLYSINEYLYVALWNGCFLQRIFTAKAPQFTHCDLYKQRRKRKFKRSIALISMVASH